MTYKMGLMSHRGVDHFIGRPNSRRIHIVLSFSQIHNRFPFYSFKRIQKLRMVGHINQVFDLLGAEENAFIHAGGTNRSQFIRNTSESWEIRCERMKPSPPVCTAPVPIIPVVVVYSPEADD